MVEMIVIDVVEIGIAAYKTGIIDVIGGDEQAEIARVRGGEGVGHDLRLGAGQRGVGGQTRARGVGDGGDGAAFAAAEGQEGDGHECDHAEQDDGDDQRNTALRRLKGGKP